MKRGKLWQENTLWQALLPVVGAGVAPLGQVQVMRAFQPTAQAEATAPRLLLHRARSRRVGAQGELQEFNADHTVLYTLRIWKMETVYQARAVTPASTSPEACTAIDILDALAAHLHSGQTVEGLAKTGLGLLRVNDIAEVPAENSQGHFEMQPMLEFTITYTQTYTAETPVVKSIEWKVYRV